PGLYESLIYNRNRQATDIRLFEVGSIFSSTRGERVAVGWVVTGARGSHWSEPARALSFADTKGLAELIADAIGAPIVVRAADDLGWAIPGERAAVFVGARQAGWIGRLTAGSAVDAPVYAGELELDALSAAALGVRPIQPL